MRLSARLLMKFKNPGQGPPMIVPLTQLAAVSQMPFRYEMKQSWFWRYWVYSWILTMPLWIWIDRKVNSPAAKKAWADKQASDHHKEHLAHMWKDIEGPNANK